MSSQTFSKEMEIRMAWCRSRISITKQANFLSLVAKKSWFSLSLYVRGSNS